jgi:uncharacterized membrane protein YecN with MAPEG domain
MDLVTLMILLALIEYMVIGMLVGQARGKYEVEAPGTTGHPVFERMFRVHQNTLEQLILFVPGIVIFSHYWDPNVAALVGLIFVIGRIVYYRGYVQDAKKRTAGFAIGFLAQATLLLGSLLGAILELIA